MKINQFGTLAIVGVVFAFTVACGGSPTVPTATSPSLGDGAPGAFGNLANLNRVRTICTSEMRTVEEGAEFEAGEVPSEEAPPVTCDAPAGAEQPEGDVVITDPPSTEIQGARRLHR
jgi:hypothetical protein